MTMNDTAYLLEAMFEADPGALAVVSGPRLVFRIANPAYCAFTPGPVESPVGRAYAEVWKDQAPEDLAARIHQVIASGNPLDVERYEIKLLSGASRFVSFRVRPLQWESEPGALLVMWDETEQEQARRLAEAASEEANRRSTELASVLNSLPDAIVIYDENGTVTSANQASRDLLGYDPVSVPRDAVLKEIDLRRMDGRPANPAETPAALALKGQQARSTRFVLVDAQGRQTNIRASATPLFSGKRLAGAVAVWSDITELVQSRQELEAVAQVARALRNCIVQEEMYPIALAQVIDLLHADGASILTPEAVTGDLVVRAAAGGWAGTVDRRMPSGTGISSIVFSTGEPIRNNDIQNDERLFKAVFQDALSCGVCVPLRVQDVSIGVLWVGRNQPFFDKEVQHLLAIADIAASSLFRARLFDQTKLRLQRLSALHSIDMAITSSLDLQLTLNVLLDQVVSQMGVDAADIILYDPALHWLEFAAGRGFLIPPSTTQPYGLAEIPAGQVVIDRQGIAINNLEQSGLVYAGWTAQQEGFRAYFAAPLIAKGQVKGVLELFQRDVFHPDSEWLEFLETLATQAAIAIDGAELFNRLQRSNDELAQAYDATIEGWSRALELRDRETEGHSRRVTEMAIQLARRLGVSDEEIPHYRRGVLLHDIGKMAIPDSILLKDGPLTSDEQETMRLHPIYAYELLRPIAYLRLSLDIPYAHHEWWDGRGYPRGLKGEEIPLAARIFSVIDVYDALSNERTYRPPWPTKKVMEYIRSRSGSQFDPRVVEEFIRFIQGYNSRTDRFRAYP